MKSSFKNESLIIWCGRISSLVVTNLLWILCCLPIFTAGAATKALYHNCYALLNDDDCNVKTFFKAFSEHFGQTTAIWMIMLAASLFLAADYNIIAYLTFPGRMAVIAIIFFVGFLLAFTAGIMFPMLSRFTMSIKDAAVNAVLLSMANLPKAIMVTALNLVPWVLLLVSTKWFLMFGVIWLLCGFGLIALYNAKLLNSIFQRFEE